MTVDTFTLKRLARFALTFREKNATLATLNDLEKEGFDKATVDDAVKAGVVVELYVTLTTGAVVKGYKKKD